MRNCERSKAWRSNFTIVGLLPSAVRRCRLPLPSRRTSRARSRRFRRARRGGCFFLRVALVVDEEAKQLAILQPLAQMKYEAAFNRDEAPGLNDVGDEVGAHLRGPLPEFLQALWREIGRYEADQQGDDECSFQEWTERRQGAIPAEFITMISESFASLLST